MVKSPVKTPAPTVSDDPISVVETMILDLYRLRDAERRTEVRKAYQAAIDRLDGVLYRLRQPGPRVYGLPASSAVTPAPELAQKPQASLPLGPVVIARKPRR